MVVTSSRLLASYAVLWPLKGYTHDEGMQKLFNAPTITTLYFSGAAVLIAVFHRDRLLRGVAAAAAVSVFVQSNDVIGELHLADTAFGHAVHWFRFENVFVLSAPAAMAGVIESVLRRPRRTRAGPLAWNVIAERVLLLSIGLIFVLPQATVALRSERLQLLNHLVRYVETDVEPLQQLRERLALLRQRDPDWPFRAYWVSDRNLHEAGATAMRTGVPVMTLPYLAALFLRARLHEATPAALDAWGVKYMIVDATFEPTAPWTIELEVPPYRLLRNDRFAGMAHASSGAHAKIESFTDDEIRLSVSGAGERGTDVQLAVAFYPRFRAWQGGRQLPVSAAAAIAGGDPEQLMVHATDGEVILRPDGPLPGRNVGWAATIFGATVLTMFAIYRKRPLPRFAQSLVERLKATMQRLPAVPSRVLWIVSTLAVVVIFAADAWPRTRRTLLLATWGSDAGTVRRTDLAKRTNAQCPESALSRRWICRSQEKVGEVLAEVGREVGDDPQRYSLWFQGEPWSSMLIVEHMGASMLHVHFRRVRVGRFLHLRMSLSNGFPRSIQLTIDGQPAIPVTPKLGWTTVPLPQATRSTFDVWSSMHFESPGAFHLTGYTDDVADNPKEGL